MGPHGCMELGVWVEGPPAGCMDPLACNFNPMAEVDNGSCVYPETRIAMAQT